VAHSVAVVTYRNPTNLYAAAGLAILLVLAAVSAGSVAAWLMCGVATVLVWLVAARPKFVTTTHDVRVTNVRTRVIPWTGVRSIEIERRFWGGNLTLELGDGSRVRSWGLGYGRGTGGAAVLGPRARGYVSRSFLPIYDSWRAGRKATPTG